MKTINLHEALKSESAQNDNRSLFERFYDSISITLFGEKSFNWGVLKGL